MDSSTNRAEQERQKQLEIQREIKRLQAQLKSFPAENTPPSSPKRKRSEPALLAPATPSPKKRKTLPFKNKVEKPHDSHLPTGKERQRAPSVIAQVDRRTVAPSNVLTKLSNLVKEKNSDALPNAVARTSSFTDKVAPKLKSMLKPDVTPDATVEDSRQHALDGIPRRDDRLAIVEDFSIGPAEHNAPFDDPNFEKLEPNSGINLLSRTLPHSDLQEYLEGRCYISPSRLYSSIRLLPNKQGYDVPVECDWITVAVVAERGPIKLSRAPVGVGPVGGEASGSGKPKNPKWSKNWKDAKKKDNEDEDGPKSGGKKYVNMKLIDFGARSRSSSSGGKAVIRGDAFLSLLLFESDSFDQVVGENGQKQKIYKGGSRGAFESMSKLREGDVIALLNPKILKPFQRSADKPHPTTNVLAVTPESIGSIKHIGRALDLGMCQVKKRDGKPCGGWCDKRVSEVCDYHVQHAVERSRAGRPEFSIGTSGMTSASAAKKPTYDPARQWGLKPEETGSDSTYIVSGHVVGGSNDTKSFFVSENMGREGQAKAKRKLDRDTDRELQTLLERDREGSRVLMKAREVGLQKESAPKQKDIKGKGKATGNPEASSAIPEPSSKSSYSAHVIKHLGFDPAVKSGQKRAGDTVTQKKVDALAAIQSFRKDIRLSPVKGRSKLRSCVTGFPSTASQSNTKPNGYTSSDDGLEDDNALPTSHGIGMIDLDGSDV